MKKDHELNQEIAAHIEEKTAELMEFGIPEAEARERARREFGNVTLLAEKSREASYVIGHAGDNSNALRQIINRDGKC